MFAISLVLAVCCGLLQALQSPTNTELSRHVGNAEATLVSFAGGTVFLIVLVALLGNGDLSRVTQVPPWQLLGGLYGVIIVIVITYAAPVLGIALTLTTLMLGQLVMGMLVDAFGLAGATVVPFSVLRLVGCLVIAVGIFLVHVGKTNFSGAVSFVKNNRDEVERTVASACGDRGAGTKASPRQTRSARPTVMLAASFIAGMGGALQAATNTTLSATIGTLEASLVSFTGGLILIAVFTLIVTRGHLKPLSSAPKWSLTGGLYGGMGVLLAIVTTPYLGVGINVATMMAGQLVGGAVIDAFGLLRSPRVRLNAWRIVGILVIAVGVAIVACALG